MANKIEYQPLSEVVESCERVYRKDHGELRDIDYYAFKSGWLESAYKKLTLQIEKHNAVIEAKNIVEPNY